MEDIDCINELVLDTLHYRKRSDPDSCIVSSLGAKSLIKSGSAALPAIEMVIRNVLEKSECEDLRSVFMGVTELLSVYVLLGVRCDSERCMSFLQNSSMAVKKIVVLSTAYSFTHRNGAYNNKTAPSSELIAFVENCAHDSDQLLSMRAQKALKVMAVGSKN